MIGTSRVKRQQQEIDRLNAENAALHEQIGTLNRANREEKARHEQAEQQLQAKLDRIEHWLPDTQTLISWGEYCRDMGISESGAREIIAMKPLYVSGELRAPEYSRRFDVSNTEIRLQRDPNGPGGFQLLIDRQPARLVPPTVCGAHDPPGLPRPPRTSGSPATYHQAVTPAPKDKENIRSNSRIFFFTK